MINPEGDSRHTNENSFLKLCSQYNNHQYRFSVRRAARACEMAAGHSPRTHIVENKVLLHADGKACPGLRLFAAIYQVNTSSTVSRTLCLAYQRLCDRPMQTVSPPDTRGHVNLMLLCESIPANFEDPNLLVYPKQLTLQLVHVEATGTRISMMSLRSRFT